MDGFAPGSPGRRATASAAMGHLRAALTVPRSPTPGDPDAPGLSKSARNRMRFLPSSYTNESVIALLPPKMTDTTDRSVVRRAGAAGFDETGYSTSAALERDMYYTTPYLTCSACNTIMFVDATNLRTAAALATATAAAHGVGVGAASRKAPELLPKCPTCQTTSAFHLGASDLQHLIGANRLEMVNRMRAQQKACRQVQGAFRAHLKRAYARAARQAHSVRWMLQYRSATAAQAMVRGRLGRRTYVVEKALYVIGHAHVSLLEGAIKSRISCGGPNKVFWYKGKQQVEILFSNYLVLVERTGFTPPRCIVEGNIREIARRILRREAELVTRVQKRFRGLSVRRYLVFFRRENFRVRELRIAAAFLCQRLFRGWRGRRVIAQRLLDRRLGARGDQYREQRAIQAADKNEASLKLVLRNKYIQERQEERAARMTGLINPGAAGGKKMKAFQESAYGYDDVTDVMVDLAKDVHKRTRADEAALAKRTERAEYVRTRQLESRGMQLYYKQEMVERSRTIIERLTKTRHKPSVDMLRDHNRRLDNRKTDAAAPRFAYPEGINNDPMAALDEKTDPRELEALQARRRRRAAALAGEGGVDDGGGGDAGGLAEGPKLSRMRHSRSEGGL